MIRVGFKKNASVYTVVVFNKSQGRGATQEEIDQQQAAGGAAVGKQIYDLITQGVPSLVGSISQNVQTVNDMQPLYDETGMKARTQARLSTYTGSEKVPEYFTNGAFVNGTVTPEVVLDDIKANPDLGSPEKNAAR